MEDQVQLPSGHVTSYVRLASVDAVTIVCLKDDHILLQREYSYPIGESLLQFPGGKIEENETPEQAAGRELKEESGFAFSQSQPLGWYYTSNRRSGSKMHVVLVPDATPAEKAGGDLEEDIESFWVPICELREMIRQGKITNGSVLAAWALLERALEN
jgi:ADP-ribose pyrophosphatase